MTMVQLKLGACFASFASAFASAAASPSLLDTLAGSGLDASPRALKAALKKAAASEVFAKCSFLLRSALLLRVSTC